MKETEGMILKNSALTQEELKQINQYTRREFCEEELYTVSVVLCDNEIDRDWERFTVQALQVLGGLFLGKTGIFNHNPQTQNQAARIYGCRVEELPERRTRAGETYQRLVARAYLPRSEKNADFILELESGIKKEVSVGCSVAKSVCSVCGADRRGKGCVHQKGKSYGGTLCHTVLDEPTDAYEWSFVAVPAQREAGVIKNYGEQKEQTMEEIWKSLRAQGEISLSNAAREELVAQWERLQEEADYGKQYRMELQKSVVRFCGMAEPGIPLPTMERVAQAMSLEDLQLFEKAFRQKAEEKWPLSPQLVPTPKKETAKMKDYQI